MKARKEKKETIEEVSEATAISYWQIQSLEQKETRGLVSEKIIKSALIQYCRYLNLNLDEVLIKNKQIYHDSPPDIFKKENNNLKINIYVLTLLAMTSLGMILIYCS